MLTRRVKAQWVRAAPALHTRRFCAASALLTRAVWNGRKPGSTEALALKAPLFTWSVKSFSCSSADHALAQVRPRQIFILTLSKNDRSLEPCSHTHTEAVRTVDHLFAVLWYVISCSPCSLLSEPARSTRLTSDQSLSAITLFPLCLSVSLSFSAVLRSSQTKRYKSCHCGSIFSNCTLFVPYLKLKGAYQYLFIFILFI